MAPWGEAAENLRMLYISKSLIAASDGYKMETRNRAEKDAQRIWNLLNGPQPKRPVRRQRAADFIRE